VIFATRSGWIKIELIFLASKKNGGQFPSPQDSPKEKLTA
jgi:hypothetical protein